MISSQLHTTPPPPASDSVPSQVLPWVLPLICLCNEDDAFTAFTASLFMHRFFLICTYFERINGSFFLFLPLEQIPPFIILKHHH